MLLKPLYLVSHKQLFNSSPSSVINKQSSNKLHIAPGCLNFDASPPGFETVLRRVANFLCLQTHSTSRFSKTAARHRALDMKSYLEKAFASLLHNQTACSVEKSHINRIFLPASVSKGSKKALFYGK
jgi:hypothetical protein